MNHIIITIESGAVADIRSTEPLQVTVVDHDLIEGGETFEERLRKAVIVVAPGPQVRTEEIAETVRHLVRACQRPADRQATAQSGRPVGAAA